MSEEKVEETAQQCFTIKKATIELMRDMSDTLGIWQSRLLEYSIEEPEKFAILKEAYKKFKEIKKGGESVGEVGK